MSGRAHPGKGKPTRSSSAAATATKAPRGAVAAQRRAITPHPATVIAQNKPPHPATVPQNKPPHPATVTSNTPAPPLQTEASVPPRRPLAPHPATVAQKKPSHPVTKASNGPSAGPPREDARAPKAHTAQPLTLSGIVGTAGLAVGYYYSAPLVGLAGALGVAKNAYDWATTYTVKASIRSIEVIDAIAVASDAKRIEGPHWAFNDDGDNLDPLHKERVARKPAVFAHSAGPFKVKIVLDVVQADYGKTYSTKWGSTGVLEGRLGALRIRCTQCPTGPGRHEVVATIVDPESGVRHYKGDVEWHLETLSGRVLVDKTFWEVFYTIAPPVKGTYENDWHPRAKYVQYAKMQGVWVEVLRLLCASGGADLVGESEPRLILQAITRYCHSEHGMTYSSSARYGAQFDGFEFDLMGYLEGTPHCFPKKNAEWQANCGDQSAAVMAFAHAVGIDVKWRSCHGFGYIRKTNLMGEDDCNNVDRHGESLVNALYENRLGFDNHCFIEYQGRIYDACIGPHLGTQSLENYLIAAIDTTPQCYPYLDRNYPLDAPPPKPGRLPWYATVKDVETSDYKGIFLAQTYESFQGF